MGNKLLISFESNKYLSNEIKKVPGTRWNKSFSRWEAPLNTYPRLLSVLDDVKISNAVMNKLKEDADLRLQVENLRKKEYHELEDYAAKIPLMSHQKKAFELHRMLKGSGNFSEMGSGKTGSAICIAHWHLEMGNIDKALVICPKSVMRGWEEQIEMFSDLTYVSIAGVKKEDRLKKLELDRNVYLINYEYTWRITDLLLEKNFGLVIADEAHRIKNPQSNQSKACYQLADNANYSIALTGTPVLNSSLDAFGVMRFIDSSVFGESYYSFRSRYFKNVGPDNSPIQI
jgi:SNF2 family DNA or RNA helicase